MAGRVAWAAVRGVRGKLRAPGPNGGGSACTSWHFINPRSPSPALPSPPWHGRERVFEFPNLDISWAVRATAFFGGSWSRFSSCPTNRSSDVYVYTNTR
jgi:hypothetical protein